MNDNLPNFPPARDDRTFLRSLSDGMEQAQMRIRFSPRSISIMIHDLAHESQVTGDLFGGAMDLKTARSDTATREKWEKVSDLMDHLR